MVLEIPPQWPKEVATYYEPIRVLGKGGFGSVILGRPKHAAPNDDNADAAQEEQVAIKVVGSKQVSVKDVLYAHREIDILAELSHDNIMKLIRYWEPAPSEHKCAAVMILSLAQGPTMHDLVQKGGALGLVFARVVMAQLIDALSYIHSRAVVHRDVKGDNVIITGANLKDDAIWDDNNGRDRDDWYALRQKWHVTLIDFGFARALTPDDMKKKPPKGNPDDALDISSGSRRSMTNSSRSIRRSVSMRLNRQMSALGNRDYAAPEITQHVTEREPSTRGGQDILHTISRNVAHYGLQVDAYALGVLMRYALTGVPPREDVREFIALHNNPLVLMARSLCCASSKKQGERTPQYRGWEKIPPEVMRMVKGLMHYDPQQRTTIRTARRYPWVDDVLEGDGPNAREVNYLDLVKNADKGDVEKKVAAATAVVRQRRRGKRDKVSPAATTVPKNRAKAKHDGPGIMALLPSAIGVSILVFGLMAKMGFRGRATVAGIDLGTTNSVICVQAPAKGVGTIDCIPDPATGSPIVPSVVSFLDLSERPIGPSSKTPSALVPHPSAVVVGQVAKRRIDSHPHQTLYNAKRVLGRSANDAAVQALKHEVEFVVHDASDDDNGGATFHVGHHGDKPISPVQVGGYVVQHLMQITQAFLGHDNVKSAVICVPAKFDARQRQLTAQAFQLAGVQVARVVEEPTAAALAYGLHRKAGVDYILVYDFGGGTLDLSLLHVSDGFVDVMGSDGDELLGGADFDAAVAHHLQAQSQGQAAIDQVAQVLQILEQAWGDDVEERLVKACPQINEMPLCTASSYHTLGEQLKIAMSNITDTENGVVHTECYALPEDFASTYMDQQLTPVQVLESFCEHLRPKTLELVASDYNRIIQPLLARAILPLQRLLRDLDLTESDIQEIVMVGGTSRMPQIRSLVHEALPGASLNTHIDPDITVAYGAASVID